ncbi:MAG: S46 family peptidase [Bacteroidales bacterium]|nr:S46 family peptidase [Bacteroidales bacterium]
MKLKSVILVLLISFLSQSFVKADEGMWLLSLIGKNYDEMKAKGLKLTAEDIYNINHSSLKDAVVGLGNAEAPFGFFCTGEIISSKGLVLTNHHCGYGAIQTHSTEENNYLLDGFWAGSFEQEIPNEGMTMTRVVSLEDITDKIIAGLSDTLSESDRHKFIDELSHKIIKEAKEADGNYGYDVKSMFEGNQFFLFKYEVFKDIRLVGTPPNSIGKFGGDTDNWMWPRHTGDFSVFRIYTDKDNKSANYSAENQPYQALHHFPISLKGVEENDYAMVMGFPGSTERFLTSYGIQQALDITNPTTVEIRDLKLKIMKSYMDESEKVYLQYASKYAQTANYWKYFQGQSQGLVRLDVYGQKKKIENEFTQWVNENTERKAKFGEALTILEKYYSGNKEKAVAKTYLFEAIFQGSEMFMLPFQLRPLAGVLSNSPDNKELIDGMVKELKEQMQEHWKDYNEDVDKTVFAALLDLYFKNVPADVQLAFVAEAGKKYKGDFNKYATDVYKKSIFANEAKFNAFLDKPSMKVLEKDPIFLLKDQIINQYLMFMGASDDYDKGMRLFEAGLLEMNPDKNYYPDANSTLRLTYGSVGDYDPRDGVHYKYYTTIDGIMEKEVKGVKKSHEFYVDEKLKQLYKDKDYGQYADKDGQMRVCFTTNNDITGGNSGSPVINGNGELIGTAFDGNWEAMSGDIAFEKNLQKCINVDVRFTLFIIEKHGGAKRLIDEMTIVK